MYFNLDYIYSLDWHNCHFLRIPKLLFEDARFLCVSFDARVFFSFLVDRVSLSARNGWTDKEGRIYIFYTLKEAMDKTGFGHNKMTHIFAELQTVGLIERVRQGQGKPIRIYVKDFCALLDEGFVPIPRTGNAPTKAPSQELDGQMEMSWNGAASRTGKKGKAETAAAAAQPEKEVEAPENLPPVLYLPAFTETSAVQPDAGTCAADAAQDPSELQPEADAAREMPAVTPDCPPAPSVLQPSDTAQETLIPPVNAPVENVETRGKFSTIVENEDAPAAVPASFYPPEAPQTSAKGQSRLPLSGSPDFRKPAANKTKENKTDFSETDLSNPPAPLNPFRRRCDRGQVGMDEIERCKREVRFQIGYDRLEETYPQDMEQVDDYVDLIVDVMCTRQDYLCVSRENRPIEQVRSQFEKLNYEHMTYILDCMKNCTTAVTNVRRYMLSTLYNAPNTIRTYYEARVRHDMAQDDWWENRPQRRDSWAS